MFAELVVDGLIQSAVFYVGFFHVFRDHLRAKVSAHSDGFDFAVDTDRSRFITDSFEVAEHIVHGFRLHLQHLHLVGRDLLALVELFNELHGFICHVRCHFNIFVFVCLLEIVQVVFLFVKVPSRQIDEILCQIDVVVVGPVVFPLHLRDRFLDDLQNVERHQAQTERVAFALEEIPRFKNRRAKRLFVVRACFGQRREQERKLDPLLQFQMADAAHAHVVADHVPAELVDVTPHVERTVREAGGFVLESVEVLLQYVSVLQCDSVIE